MTNQMWIFTNTNDTIKAEGFVKRYYHGDYKVHSSGEALILPIGILDWGVIFCNIKCSMIIL
jgi:hypothetical protein